MTGEDQRRTDLVSVILPARNANAFVGVQITALLQQSYSGPWELIVVDNGSSDGTGKFVKHLAATLARPQSLERFVVERFDTHYGHASPRNRGVDVSGGSWLAFCDADDEVADQWLEALMGSAEQQTILASVQYETETGERRVKGDIGQVLGHPFAPTGGMFCSRELFCSIGGFDPAFDRGAADVDFCIRAARQPGSGLQMAVNADYFVGARKSGASIFQQSFRYGGNQVRLVATHRNTLGIEPSSWRMLTYRLRDLVRKAPSVLTERRVSYLQMAGRTLGMIFWSARLRTRYWELWV